MLSQYPEENWIAGDPHLLAANEAVRLVAQDPARLASEVRNKVEVVADSLDDEAILQQALENAQSVFLVVPPPFTNNNDVEFYLCFTRPAPAAIKSQGVKRLVHVSVLGRDMGLAKDEEIERSGVDCRTSGARR